MERRLRWVTWAVLWFQFFGLGAPVLHAQFVYGDYATQDDSTFQSTVYSTLSEKDQLEQSYLDQQARLQQAEQALAELKSMQPPPGYSQAEWNQLVQRRSAELGQYTQENTSLLQRTKDRLTQTYNNIEGFKDRIRTSSNDQVKQLGTLVGVAGNTTVPVWARPTAQGIAATTGNVVRQARVGTINARIGTAESPGAYVRWSNAADAAAQNHAAAYTNAKNVKVSWTPEVRGEGANAQWWLVPKNSGTGTYNGEAVNTGVKANQQTANGNWVENPAAKAYVNDIGTMRTTRTNIDMQLSAARHKLGQTTDTAVKNGLQKHINNLEAKRTALNSDISAYEQSHPSLGQQAKQLGVNAGKWALTSMAITYGADVVGQLSDNGWNLAAVDWTRPLGTFTTKEFWGGTAGSFVGSMAGTVLGSLIPGGSLIAAGARIGLSVGGAALGWQVGSGAGLQNMDWVHLGATTVGATVGIMLGGALLPFLGPFGPIVGGILGNLAADWVLKKIREWGAAKNVSFSRPESGASQYPTYTQAPSGYQGPSPVDGGYYQYNQNQGSSSYGADQAAQLGEERKQCMSQFQQAVNQNPPDMNQIRALRERLVQIDQQLNAARQGRASELYGK